MKPLPRLRHYTDIREARFNEDPRMFRIPYNRHMTEQHGTWLRLYPSSDLPYIPPQWEAA